MKEKAPSVIMMDRERGDAVGLDPASHFEHSSQATLLLHEEPGKLWPQRSGKWGKVGLQLLDAVPESSCLPGLPHSETAYPCIAVKVPWRFWR